MMAFIFTAGIACAANQPKLDRKVFRHGETFLDFTNATKGVYSYSEESTDGNDVITRSFTWSAKLLAKKTNYSDGPIYEWQITIKVSMSYGTKNLTFYIKAYENGSLKGASALCADGTNWEIL